MLITFNKSGSLANIDFQYDSFSQGDNNIHIINVIIDDESFNNLDYNGYVQFLREGETTPSPKLIMTHTEKGYTFKMNTEWYTAIAGTLKMTIEIKQYDEDGLQSNKAFGVINIPVMESVSGISEVETTITNEEYLALVNSLNEKANVNITNLFKKTQVFENGIEIITTENSSGASLLKIIDRVMGSQIIIDSNGNITHIDSAGDTYRISIPLKNGKIALTDNQGNFEATTLKSIGMIFEGGVALGERYSGLINANIFTALNTFLKGIKANTIQSDENVVLDSPQRPKWKDVNGALKHILVNGDAYSKEEINEMFANFSTLDLKLVDTLPTENISTSTIYLKPLEVSGDQNIYEEYIYVNSRWEAIGTTRADLTDYYKKPEIDAMFASNVAGADGLHYEGNKLFLTKKGVIISEPVEIVGGGGGGGTSSNAVLTLTNMLETNNIKNSYGSEVKVKFNFTSVEDGQPTGKGICNVIVNGVSRKNITIEQGATEIEISDVLNAGENAVKIKCTDIYGNSRVLAYTITLIDLTITSTFDDALPYDATITYKYIPYGLTTKTIHFILDGTEIATKVVSTNGKQYTQLLPAMTHGSHKFEVYMTADIEEDTIESNKLTYDIIFVEAGNQDIIIASNYEAKTLKQGELLSIPYVVYNPASLTSDIELVVKNNDTGEITSTKRIVVDRNKQFWNTRDNELGNNTLTIKVLKITPAENEDEEDLVEVIATKEFTATITENNVNIEAVTNDLELHLTSNGRSNSEDNPDNWSYGNITTTFENVNFKSTGWVLDENGDTCLRLNGDARAVVHFKPFMNDLRVYGKTLEFEFAIRDVNNRNAVVINCLSGGIGFEFTADRAILKSEQTSVECNYDDEQKIRVAFVVESKNEYRLLSVYLNGVLSGVKQYPTTDNFQQTTPLDISIGSSYCGIDLYNIRSYSTSLTSSEVNDNYIYDTADFGEKLELYEENQVYDEYQNISYEKMKTKIPVVIVTGKLPTSKEDEVPRVKFKYENPFYPELDFEDTCKIAVQGTSSQYYVVKNYKISKFGNEENAVYRHASGQLATGVFCLKADYAESTGTHNTQNANFVETLYSEPTPAQEENALCRTTIYGFPCVMFHRETENDELSFVGKYNFNYDKGSENVYGFTQEYDVESWEFLNNTSDACLFKSTLPTDWSTDFEARYPEKTTNITRFRTMHNWVVSTRYNLTKFKNEFERYFDLHYCLIYYVYTFVMLMVDQRAKNMFLTYWAKTGKWQPWFYDNDTCLGINNEGQLVFDYYHEDIDKVNNANVYNGQESVLWTNFRQAFADEIQEMYKSLRSSGKLTYDKLHEAFVENGSNKWSASIYNEDSEYKYISMLKSDNDASNLYQVRGTGEEHFRYFMDNRFKYCDSKWNALSYADNYVSLRIYTPEIYAGVTPNANITITPYSNMYAGVKYKANGILQQKRVAKNEETIFEAPNETFNDTETAIYGASELSSLGDLAPLYCGTINVSKATKLIELKIGDKTAGYSNTNLTDLSVGTNKLLKKIDVRNCPNLTQPLSLAYCPNIEEIYAQGSGITGVELPESGYLKIVKLPHTITNLTIKNQLYIEDFSLEGYDSLKTMWIENCPNIDTSLLINSATNLERIRLVGVDWSFDNTEFLLSLATIGGIDENGNNTDSAQIVGTCHITSLTGQEMKELSEKYPYLTITYDNLTATLIYMSEDGSVELGRETILNGGNGSGITPTPSKPDTAQYDYEFAGWSLTPNGTANSTAIKNVKEDRVVYAAFSQALKYYLVRFYNESTLLETQSVPYGGTAVYSGSEPTKTGVDDPENYTFNGWNPAPTNITGNLDCYAQFKYGAIETTVLSATLPKKESKPGATNVGNDVYLFIGDSDTNKTKIYKFDTIAETSTLITTIPERTYGSPVRTIGTNIYTLGGSIKSNYKFDTISNTVTKLAVRFEQAPLYSTNAVVGDNAYIFGGNVSGDYAKTIYKFDSVNETITKLSTLLPVSRSSVGGSAVGTNIYILPGTSTGTGYEEVWKFDTTTETLTTLNVSWPKPVFQNKRNNYQPITIGTNIYVFGGDRSNNALDDIIIFDTTTETFRTSPAVLPYAVQDAAPVLVNGSVYLFGGHAYGVGSFDTIIKISNLG